MENDPLAEARAKGIEALTRRAATVAFSTEFLKFVEEDQGIEPDTKRFLQAGLDALSEDVLTSVYAHNHSVIGGFRFRHKFGGNPGFEKTLPELKQVLEQLGWFSLQNPAIYKGGGLAIGSRPNPLHGTARFYIRLKVGTRKDDAVRLWRNQALLKLFRLHCKIENKPQRCVHRRTRRFGGVALLAPN